ncbi:Rv3654c family TadE-like protein [Streptomyces sp. NPDC017941]|uniref:Rv3654c family TadE-like protein n=1 Tax=Streptomyces sp. NPDC017941 TaxID=3365018 RepID=UPI00378FABCF
MAVPGRERGRGRDRGSATVWAVVGITVLCVVAGSVLAMGQATVARHRAGGAADLAALAAADHWANGQADACTKAGRVARAQDTRVVRCVLVGEVSDVTAAAEFGPFEVQVRSRAGPAAPVPGPPLPARPAFEDEAEGRQGARGEAP